MSVSYKNYIPQQAKEILDKGGEFIDIREPDEFDQVRIPGAKLLPMSEMNQRMQELPKDKEVVVYCRSGSRSSYLINILSANGYNNLINLQGGLLDWYDKGLPVDTEPVEETYKAVRFEEISVSEASDRMAKNLDGVRLIDVRETFEFSSGHAPESENIPLSQIPEKSAGFDKEQEILLICNSGNRSAMAANWYSQNGFTKIANIEGGIYAWQMNGLPVE